MPRSIEAIRRALTRFESAKDGWPALEALLAELKSHPEQTVAVDALLNVLERHPGAASSSGVLMTITHLLEATPGYEVFLVRSMRRRPSVVGATLLGRLLNSGVPVIGNQSVVALLESLKASSRAPRAVKSVVRSILEGR